MSTSDYKLIKIETFVLKVRMNCQGCINKVRKVLQKVEGVCKVDINAEEEKAIVTGIVNPSTLVKKLAKFGKHADIWNAGYNSDQDNNQTQIINDPSDSENQYMIPTFGEDHRGSQWGFNPDMGFKTMESGKTEESIIPVMSLASFYENSEGIYSGIENQDWEHNFPGMSSTSKYGHQPSPMANRHGYHHEFYPSNRMQFLSYHHGPEKLTSTWRMPTDMMMNAYVHH